MNYLISGVPCCRKTTFGDWLQERGWRHIDMEAWDGSEEHKLWNQSSVSDFIAVLSKESPNIVFTWGFPPNDWCMNAARSFKESGVSIWWFDGDESAARKAKIGRDNGEVISFDQQMARIQAHQNQLDALYGDNKIRTLDAQGNYLEFDDIAKAMNLPLEG